MAKEIKIQKNVYQNPQFDKVVDRSFSFYNQPPAEEQELTIEDFFNLYERFYLEIDINGDEQSHEYLIKRSSELVDFEKDTSDIEPLLDEIAQLREQLLGAQQQIIDLTTQSASE